MDAVTADQMGMLGTMINCLCVADALRKEGVDAVVMSAVGYWTASPSPSTP